MDQRYLRSFTYQQDPAWPSQYVDVERLVSLCDFDENSTGDDYRVFVGAFDTEVARINTFYAQIATRVDTLSERLSAVLDWNESRAAPVADTTVTEETALVSSIRTRVSDDSALLTRGLARSVHRLTSYGELNTQALGHIVSLAQQKLPDTVEQNPPLPTPMVLSALPFACCPIVQRVRSQLASLAQRYPEDDRLGEALMTGPLGLGPAAPPEWLSDDRRQKRTTWQSARTAVAPDGTAPLTGALTVAEHRAKATEVSRQGFKFGLAVGVLLPLLGISIVALSAGDVVGESGTVYPSLAVTPAFISAVPIYISCLLPALMLAAWGYCVSVWRKCSVDYSSLLRVPGEPPVLSPQQAWKLSALLGDVWCVSTTMFVGDLLSLSIVGPPSGLRPVLSAYPLLLLVATGMVALAPFHIFHLRARKLFGRVLTSILRPFKRSPRLVEVLVADTLISLVPALRALGTVLCSLSVGLFNSSFSTDTEPAPQCVSVTAWSQAVFGALPFGIRCAQCLVLARASDGKLSRLHSYNLVKYFSGFVASVLGGARILRPSSSTLANLWFASQILSALLAGAWDVFMVWGLIERGKSGWRVRSGPLGSPRLYIVTAIVNLVLHMNRVVVLAPSQSSIPPSVNYLLDFLYPNNRTIRSLLVFALEVVRRAIWLVLRVELEAVKGVQGFKKFT